MSPALPLKNCATSVCRSVRSASVARPTFLTSWKSNAYSALVIGSGPSDLDRLLHDQLVHEPEPGPEEGCGAGLPHAGCRIALVGVACVDAGVLHPADHGCRRGCAGMHTPGLRRAVGNRGQACGERVVEAGLVGREVRDQHVVGCLRHGRRLRTAYPRGALHAVVHRDRRVAEQRYAERDRRLGRGLAVDGVEQDLLPVGDHGGGFGGRGRPADRAGAPPGDRAKPTSRTERAVASARRRNMGLPMS